MPTCTAESIRLFKSINWEDSALFGLAVDIFKVTLLMTVIQTGGLQEFGFDPEGIGGDDLAFDFSRIQFLSLNINKGEFGPPYLEDGDLSAINFGQSFRKFEIREAGASGMTDRYDVYREMVPIHEVTLDFGCGSMKFAFCDLKVRKFVPEDLDS
jgi:hypothetical protein